MIACFSQASRGSLFQKTTSALLLLFILFVLLAKYELLFRLSINWDEFRFLSDVYKYQRHQLPAPLQTFHVHFFTWLTTIDGTEIDQIYAGRLSMFILQLGSCWLLYLIARNFYGVIPSLFVIFSYLSFTYVILHGSSFRYDSIITFLLLLSLQLLLSGKNLFAALLSGCIFALALITSIKSALFLPVLLLPVFIMDFQGFYSAASFKRTFWFVVSLSLAFTTLYFLHKTSLVTPPEWNSGGYASRSFDKMFLSEGFFPRLKYLSRSLFQDIFLWIIAFCSLCLLIPFRKKETTRKNLILLSFFISLAPVILYRNAYPYFYVVMLAPISIPMGSFLSNRYFSFCSANQVIRHSVSALYILLVTSIAFRSGSIINKYYFDQVAPQKELLELVHKLFPDPVPYIDRCSVVSSFSKVGFFMSTWGIDNYLRKERPILNNLLRERAPRFLIANATPLDIFHDYKNSAVRDNYRLLEEDWKVLKQNYIHHWGLLYVAGKQFYLKENSETTFDILVPGLYTIESNNSVILDEQLLSPSAVFDLKTGTHTVKVKEPNTILTLRWGDHLYRPDQRPSIEPFFTRL